MLNNRQFSYTCIWYLMPSHIGNGLSYFLLNSAWQFEIPFFATIIIYGIAFYCIFEKIDRIASEEVIFALVKSKWLPILVYLLYETEACPIRTVQWGIPYRFRKVLFRIFGAQLRSIVLYIWYILYHCNFVLYNIYCIIYS